MLNVEERYLTSKSLNQWVIQRFLRELNDKSNLKVSLRYIKEGKKVSALRFDFLEQ